MFIPLSLYAISRFFPPGEGWADVFPPVNAISSVGIYLLAALFLVCTIYSMVFKKPGTPAKIFLVFLCAAPLIWQIDLSFVARQFGNGLGGYSFWIPVVLKGFGLIF
jgi:hypothetical protein